MTDVKRQLEYQTEVQTEETETDLAQSEESRNGDAIFFTEDNKGYSNAKIYNWNTELAQQKSIDDQNNEKNSTDRNKRNDEEAEELKENTDPSPNGQQNTENCKHDNAVLFLLK